MKTAKVLSILMEAILLAVLGSSSCESEDARQHHLYNLQICVAETYKADESAFDTSDWKNDKSMADVVNIVSDPNYQQQNHNSRAADCMRHTEKTTLEYQLAKHDDYGKVKVVVPKQRAVDHNSHPEIGGMESR